MQSALEALHEYYATFSTLDLAAIASHFSEPCLSMSSQGVYSAHTRAELVTAFAPVVEGLKAKGYGRSEFADAEVTPLGPAAALVRGVAIRYSSAGPELERVAIGYVMHQSGGSWKVAVMVMM